MTEYTINDNVSEENADSTSVKSITKKKKKKFDIITALLAVAIIVVSIISVNMYIEKYECNYDGEVLARELDDAKNDTELLNVEYQRLCDVEAVASYAKEKLMMKEMNDYQIQYIEDLHTNSSQVMNNESDGNLIARITKTLSIIMEYFE